MIKGKMNPNAATPAIINSNVCIDFSPYYKTR